MHPNLGAFLAVGTIFNIASHEDKACVALSPSPLSALFLSYPSFHSTISDLSLPIPEGKRGECQAFPGAMRKDQVLRADRTRLLKLVPWGMRGKQG